MDVALRVGNLPDSNLVARKLAMFRTQIYASPAYIERYGEPLHPDDLRHHRALFMRKSAQESANFVWKLNDGKDEREFAIDPVMIANDPGALRGPLLGGEGLMLAGDVTLRAYAEHGLVQRVLAGWRGPDYDFSAVFPRGQVQSPKVRAFVDFLVERLNFDADYMHVLCEDGKRFHKLIGAAVEAEAKASAERAIALQPISKQNRVREVTTS